MKHLIEFPLEDGDTVIVEVDVPDGGGGLAPAGGPPTRRLSQRVVEAAGRTFEEALGSVRPAASALLRRLKELRDPPDEITVEFGLILDAEAGAVIASGSVEANFRVTLTWRQVPARSGQDTASEAPSA